MADSGYIVDFDDSEYEIVDLTPTKNARPIMTDPDHGVCYSIKFYGGANGEFYIPEKFVAKYPDFAALFDEYKHLDCSPMSRETATIVLWYLRRERLPGRLRGEIATRAARRLFKMLIIFREDAPAFPIDGLEEMVFQGILHFLNTLPFLDLLQITTKEREWLLSETDDLLIRALTARLSQSHETIADECLSVMTDFFGKYDEAKWGLLGAAVLLKVQLQRSERARRRMVLERCGIAESQP
ncbi:hypothetical protein FLONG3_3219 [Fusarium longipes]|uniref:Uncharacterized protein n=1 Tax=Fusarium longipes TaxID=694270 RepID=A0A395T2Y6_9HYPO|nr:hypothetical protein FLONG3_3219 [Fusarium longipes]